MHVFNLQVFDLFSLHGNFRLKSKSRTYWRKKEILSFCHLIVDESPVSCLWLLFEAQMQTEVVLHLKFIFKYIGEGNLHPGLELILNIHWLIIDELDLLLLLLSRVSRVRFCATPLKAAQQAPLSPGFSRQEYWSGLPFPSPMHESEKWKWSCSVVSDS